MHWMMRHRLWLLAGICLLWTGGVLLVQKVPQIPFLSAVWSGEQAFYDLMQREGRKTDSPPELTFVGIDQTSLEFKPFDEAQLENNRALQLMAAKPFPWSREVWALFLDRVIGAGARLVMFDLIFNNPNEGDAAFAAAIERHRDKVVLGANFDFAAVEDEGGAVKTVVPNATLIPPPQMLDDRVGYIVLFPDPLDERIRSVRYTITDLQLAGQMPHPGEVPYVSMVGRGLEKIGHGEAVPRDLFPHHIRFSPLDRFQPIPVWQIFDPAIWKANYGNGEFFKDRIIVIGASSQVAHDVFATPMSPDTPGPALHLHAFAAALRHEFLSFTPPTVRYLLVGGAGLLAWILIGFIRRPLVSLLALLGVTAVYLVVARLFYDFQGLFLLTVPVLSAFLLSGLTSMGVEYVLERIERTRTRRTLERYVSKNLVAEILENPESYYNTLKGVRKPATILFSDIVGFTNMTETADPEQLVLQLNQYLDRMVAMVFKYEGTLDKFIGDAVMAVWGMTRSAGVAGDAKLAARSALGMKKELAGLNKMWAAEGSVPLGIGIGLNQGEVLAGNIGSTERADLTVIGDSVNLASRLESLTRTYGVDILVGANVLPLLRDDFHLRSVALVQVKGKTQPVEVGALLGAKDEPFDEELLKWLGSYEEAMEKFRARKFTDAKILLSRFLEFYPEDFLARMYLDRCLEYEKEPPDEAWNAVEVFKKK